MRKILLIILLLFTTNSYAGTLFSDTMYSTDTDGNRVISETIGIWKSKDDSFDYGLAIGSRWFENYSSQRLSLLYDKRFTKWGTYGDIGIETHGSIPSGDLNAVRWFNRGQIGAHYTINLIDSVGGLEKELNVQNFYISSEFNVHERLTLYGFIGRAVFSDSNNKYWHKIIAIVNVVDGLSLIGQYEGYTFSDNSPDYFTPEDYNRILGGITTSHGYNKFHFRTRIMYGRQMVNDERFRSHYIRLNLSHRTTERLTIAIETVWDQANPYYRYDQYLLKLTYRF